MLNLRGPVTIFDPARICVEKQWFKQPGIHLAYPEQDPPYPFQRIKFVDGRDTGVMMVAATVL